MTQRPISLLHYSAWTDNSNVRPRIFAPMSTASHVSTAPLACDHDQPAETAALHVDESAASSSNSIGVVEQPRNIVAPEKPRGRPAEKVTYDQLGRRRVKWKPPTSSRGPRRSYFILRVAGCATDVDPCHACSSRHQIVGWSVSQASLSPVAHGSGSLEAS